MIVVADASVLVAELLRRRGRDLLSHPDLQVVVAEDQWNETLHELDKRLVAITQHRQLPPPKPKNCGQQCMSWWTPM